MPKVRLELGDRPIEKVVLEMTEAEARNLIEALDENVEDGRRYKMPGGVHDSLAKALQGS